MDTDRGFFRYVGVRRLHALKMGKIPKSMTWTVCGKDAIIIPEAVAGRETWIWRSYFGMLESCNDINMLDRSPLFAKLANGEAPLGDLRSKWPHIQLWVLSCKWDLTKVEYICQAGYKTRR